jgi:hypothetical protein
VLPLHGPSARRRATTASSLGLRGRSLGLLFLGLSACVGSIGDPPADDQPPLQPAAPPFEPGESGLRRLTVEQYENAIRDVLGDEIVVPTSLEPDSAVEGLVALGAGLTTISSRGVEQYETAAYSIADQAMSTPEVRARILPCTPSGAGDAECARAFVERFGRRMFRRALEAAEVDALVGVATQAATTLGTFDLGIEYAMAAILQSPSFLFRTELGEPDPDAAGWLRYDGYELATRLAFFFWNTVPDEALLDAAESGELEADEGLAAQVERLLADDRLHAGVRAFFTDMLRLKALDDLTKDPTVFVLMSPEVGPSAREETLLGVEHLVFDLEGDYRDLLTTRTAFLNRRLAAIYDVPAPAREGFGEAELPEDGLRMGLLGQVSFLAANAHAESTSATLRGKFIREVLLCASIPPPPAMQNVALPEPSPDALTLRDRSLQHVQNGTCRGCHQLMDPMGLSLENFDGLGRYRETDHGAVIDASGELNGIPFENAEGVGYILHDHPDVPRCLVRTMYRYATGRLEASGETEALRQLTDTFESDGYRVKDLMREIALHRSFRLATAPAGTEEAP